MDPHHDALPSDLSFWSYAPLQTEDLTTWLNIAGHAQPTPQFDLGCSFTDIDWNSADTLQNLAQGGATPVDRQQTNDAAFNSLHSYSDVSLGYFTGISLDVFDPWYIPTPSLTTADSVTSSPGDTPWPALSQSPKEITAGTQDQFPVSSVPNAPTTISSAELAWTFDPGLLTTASFGYTPVDGNIGAPIAPQYSESFVKFVGPAVEPCIPAGWGAAGLIVPDQGAAVAPIPEITTLPERVLGKRRRGVDDALGEGNLNINHGHRPSPRKKGKAKMATTTGVLEADKPATRTPDWINEKSKATGRGAERLATPNAQGVSYQSLQGPSIQQVSMGAIVQGEQPWVEGSVEGVTGHHVDSAVLQQDNMFYYEGGSRPREAESSTFFYIPKSLNTRQRALLEANSDNWARGTIRVIKCQLCPNAGFGNFEMFKRHCNAAEAHPDSISFCVHCGDFFARPDSLNRHYKRRPQECHDVSPAKAETKRQETERVLREFEERLVFCLKSNEDIGKPFAEVVKEMYPESSKRGSRQQGRLHVRRSRS